MWVVLCPTISWSHVVDNMGVVLDSNPPLVKRDPISPPIVIITNYLLPRTPSLVSLKINDNSRSVLKLNYTNTDKYHEACIFFSLRKKS